MLFWAKGTFGWWAARRHGEGGTVYPAVSNQVESARVHCGEREKERYCVYDMEERRKGERVRENARGRSSV